MAKKFDKSNLGKGIRALLAQPEQLEAAVLDNPQLVVTELAGNIAFLPISQIEPNPFQPRLEFDQVALDELSASIAVHGLIQPVTVRRLSDKSYQLISGERRFRASQLAGLTEIPAYVRIADDQQMLEMALIENIQRQDLNSIEVAISYQRLIDECNLTHETMSERVGKQRSTITNYLRLLKLPPEIQRAIKDRKLSMGHARALVGVDDIALQLMLFKETMDRDLSVRAIEDLIRKYQEGKSGVKSKKGTAQSEEIRHIQDQFSAFFGCKVQIKRGPKGKGQVIINFNHDADLNRLIATIDKD